MESRFVVGKTYHRGRDIHDLYGGNRQSGIAACASHPFVFLFVSPKGEQHGYRDGWKSEEIFTYTGEGQLGEMEMARGNRAIQNHVVEQRELHVFEKTGSGMYKYVGQFEHIDHEVQEGRDTNDQPRSLIVFHLRTLEIRADGETS